MSLPSPINDSFGKHLITLSGHSSIIWSVAFSPSGQLLASGSADNTIRLWNAKTWADIGTLIGHSKPINSVAFSPDSTMLASGSDDTSIKLWDVRSKAQIADLDGHSDLVWSVAFSPDGATLVSGSQDKTIQLWDVKSRTRIHTLKGHSARVFCAIFSPDGQKIASGSEDKTVRLWDVASRTNIKTLGGHLSTTKSVAFAPGGEDLASASFDKTIRLWNVATGDHIATLNGHTNDTETVAFSSNGNYLASGSDDQTIRLWDRVSRTQLSTLKGHTGYVRSVAFSPNGAHLASGSSDFTVRIWDVSLKEVRDSQDAMIASDLARLTLEPAKSQQEAITSVPPNKDITGSNSLEGQSSSDHGGSDDPALGNHTYDGTKDLQGSTLTADLVGLTQDLTDTQQDVFNPASASISLSNDITGSITLEGITLIGFGGFGDVFSGAHNVHGKVALKRPRRLLEEALIRRFLREVDLWCSVSHRYILPCLGMCKIGGEVYVVSPFIENGDLLSCMARGMDLNRSKLLFEVAEALTHLHHRGIVHGDVKAQNILLADDGSALLCDFGQAKAFDTMATSTEAKGAGSVRWMAPELFLGEGRSMASDVYSLGITIAEVLSGRVPYHEMTETLAVMFHVVHYNGRPPKEPLTSNDGKSYATLWETAEKCWAKDVKARPYMAQVLGMLFPLTRETT